MATDPGSTQDENGHGTAIAETILLHAAQARIVPLKLMGKCGYPRISHGIEEAFEWIISHHKTSGIRIICAAMADGSHLTTDEPYRRTALCRQVAALRLQAVATVVPAGNGFRRNAQGMAWPAILREVVSVGELTVGSAFLAPVQSLVDHKRHTTYDKSRRSDLMIGDKTEEVLGTASKHCRTCQPWSIRDFFVLRTRGKSNTIAAPCSVRTGCR